MAFSLLAHVVLPYLSKRPHQFSFSVDAPSTQFLFTTNTMTVVAPQPHLFIHSPVLLHVHSIRFIAIHSPKTNSSSTVQVPAQSVTPPPCSSHATAMLKAKNPVRGNKKKRTRKKRTIFFDGGRLPPRSGPVFSMGCRNHFFPCCKYGGFKTAAPRLTY